MTLPHFIAQKVARSEGEVTSALLRLETMEKDAKGYAGSGFRKLLDLMPE